jgi:hypothetical protein
MEFCSNVVESDDYVAMRFSLSTLLYTQNGLTCFYSCNIKEAGEKRKCCKFSFRQHYFYTFVASRVITL